MDISSLKKEAKLSAGELAEVTFARGAEDKQKIKKQGPKNTVFRQEL